MNHIWDFSHKYQLSPMDFIFIKLQENLPSLIALDELLSIQHYDLLKLNELKIISHLFSNVEVTLKVYSWSGTCCFCKCHPYPGHKNKNYTLIAFLTYTQTLIFNVDENCYPYFLFAVRISPFYKNYLLLLSSSHLVGTQMFHKDIIRYIGFIIINYCNT